MLVYLHGFNSSPQSIKANQLRDHLINSGRGEEFICPTLPWHFSDAIKMIETILLNLKDKKICLIGSSLGGFYATYFAEKGNLPAILINPAIKPHESLVKYLGLQRNIYSGEEYILKVNYLDDLLRLYCSKISNPKRYLLLTAVKDEVLDYREGVEKFKGCEQIIVQEEDHAFLSFPEYFNTVMQFADEHQCFYEI